MTVIRGIWRKWTAVLTALGLAGIGVYLVLYLTTATPQPSVATQVETSIKGWQKGKGWGWIWGKDDEVGSLNAMTAASQAAALALAKKGLASLLSLKEDLEVVAQASHGGEAIAQTEKLQPDVILMDVRMPICDGVVAIVN